MQTLRGWKYLMNGWLAMDLIMLKEIETYLLLERSRSMDKFLEVFLYAITLWILCSIPIMLFGWLVA